MPAIEFKYEHDKWIDDMREEFGNDRVTYVFARFLSIMMKEFMDDRAVLLSMKALGERLGPSEFCKGGFAMLYAVAGMLNENDRDLKFDDIWSFSAEEIRELLEEDRNELERNAGDGPKPD